MKRQNQSSVVEFILLGFSNFPELQGQLFGVFLVDYLVTLMGNAIIIVIISLEQSLHVPMYLFLLNLSVVHVSFSAVIMPEMLVALSNEKKVWSPLQAVLHRRISFFFLVGPNVFSWGQWLMTNLLQSAVLWATQWLWTKGFSWSWLYSHGSQGSWWLLCRPHGFLVFPSVAPMKLIISSVRLPQG